MLKKIFVGIIGPNKDTCTNEIYKFGLNLGKYLTDHDYIIVCGGKGGIMEAVCKGAHESENYKFGCTIGIIPEEKRSSANKYVDIVIPTGVGIARNIQIINTADILIAAGGGSGTLSETAFAWQKGKHVLCHTEFKGWAKELAGKQIDKKYDNLLIPFSDLNDVNNLIKSYL